MKANELMIGDWISDGKNIAQIVMITCDGIIETTFNESSNIELIESISVTPEILERNGFLANSHVYPYPYYEYEVKENKLKIGFAFPQGNRTSYKEPWICVDTECVYIEHLPCIFVHQLQQVLRLCGIEKEIEL